MRKLQYLLFAVKRSQTCYYIIFIISPVSCFEKIFYLALLNYPLSAKYTAEMLIAKELPSKLKLEKHRKILFSPKKESEQRARLILFCYYISSVSRFVFVEIIAFLD